MNNNIFDSWLDLQFRFYAYVVGKVYLAPIYLFGLFIPSFKQLLHDYETGKAGNSKFVISITTGSILFGIFYYFTYSTFSLIQYLLWYTGYFIWGYFALFLLSNYEHKEEAS